MSDALTPEAEGYLRNCVDMRFGDAADDAELLFAEIDRLRGELEAANNANRLGAECESDLAKRLSDRDRHLAELREACQPLIAAATSEVYSSVRCVMVHDLNRLAALLPPTAKEEPRGPQE